MRLTIKGVLPDLNAEINAAKKHWAAYRDKKAEWTWSVCMQVKQQKPPKAPTPARISFQWFVPNKRKDPDNIAFAKKYILDGLVSAGVLENDSHKQIHGFSDSFCVDKENPRVEINIAPLDTM